LPITLLHHPIAYLIYRVNSWLILPGLIVGSMFPDLEIPFIILIFGNQGISRMIMHSLIGSITIGTFFATIFTIKIYPTIVYHLFHVDKEKIQSQCKLSFPLIFSVLVGNISHVLLDVTNHPYNPILWPFRPAVETPSRIYFALGNPLGSLWIQAIMGALLLVIIMFNRKNLFEKLLVG
jgi:membrane-bound metal-dependent hydrolase YbcI (DUF457 family)